MGIDPQPPAGDSAAESAARVTRVRGAERGEPGGWPVVAHPSALVLGAAGVVDSVLLGLEQKEDVVINEQDIQRGPPVHVVDVCG